MDPNVKKLTKDELLEMMKEGGVDDKGAGLALAWIERGDGVAIYENQAFDSANFGHKQYTSFGSSAAMLEVDEPPQRLPDIGGRINWAYQLIGVVPKASS